MRRIFPEIVILVYMAVDTRCIANDTEVSGKERDVSNILVR